MPELARRLSVLAVDQKASPRGRGRGHVRALASVDTLQQPLHAAVDRRREVVTVVLEILLQLDDPVREMEDVQAPGSREQGSYSQRQDP